MEAAKVSPPPVVIYDKTRRGEMDVHTGARKMWKWFVQYTDHDATTTEKIIEQIVDYTEWYYTIAKPAIEAREPKKSHMDGGFRWSPTSPPGGIPRMPGRGDYKLAVETCPHGVMGKGTCRECGCKW